MQMLAPPMPQPQQSQLPQTQSQTLLPFEAAGASAGTAAHTLLSHALPAEAGVWDELRADSGALRSA